MRTDLNFSPLRKLWSKIGPSRMLRSFALMMAPARASLMCSTVTMLSSFPSISNAVPTRKSFVSINQVLQCHQVAARPEPGDDAGRGGGRHVAGSERLLPGVQVRDVNLDGRDVERAQTIVERVTIVGQRPRVDDDAGR